MSVTVVLEMSFPGWIRELVRLNGVLGCWPGWARGFVQRVLPQGARGAQVCCPADHGGWLGAVHGRVCLGLRPPRSRPADRGFWVGCVDAIRADGSLASLELRLAQNLLLAVIIEARVSCTFVYSVTVFFQKHRSALVVWF